MIGPEEFLLVTRVDADGYQWVELWQQEVQMFRCQSDPVKDPTDRRCVTRAELVKMDAKRAPRRLAVVRPMASEPGAP